MIPNCNDSRLRDLCVVFLGSELTGLGHHIPWNFSSNIFINKMSDDILPEFDQASVTAAANWLHERSQLDANQKSNSHEEMIAGILSEFVEFNNLQGIITNDNSSSKFFKFSSNSILIYLYFL